MRIIDAAAVAAALDDRLLVERLRQSFAAGATAPLRHHHELPALTLLLMPAWDDGRHLGIKIVTVAAENAARGLPSVIGQYLLLDAATGEPRALIDGSELTARRTAAASALAADYLARRDASRLLVVGTGRLAPHLIRAHSAVRPIAEVRVWGRDPAKAARLGTVARDLAEAVGWADIISCATLAREPLIHGRWLRPGQHLDLVGGFTPTMREADDTAIARARVYVDTYAGALKEAGDIVQPLRNGVLTEAAIAGELAQLVRAERAGRGGDDEITLFKSVGTALEDLAAAALVLERAP